MRRRYAVVFGLGVLCQAALCVLSYAPRASADLAYSELLRERHVMDADDLLAMSRRQPAAAEALLRGEQVFQKGDVRQAAELFKSASEQAPQSALSARRLCESLTELGRRRDALSACERSIRLDPTPMGFRAYVAAVTSGTPTPEETALALRYAREAKRRMPDQPWGYAAECDIAWRLGDTEMFETCSRDLKRIAPGHYETARFARGLPRANTPRGLFAFWGLTIAVCVISALHAAFRRMRGASMRAGAVAASVLVGTAAFTISPSAVADEEPPPEHVPAGGLSKWRVDDKDPSKNLPSAGERDRDPLQFGYLMMDLADKADAAIQKGDIAGAAGYYEAMVKAVPDVAIGYRKACELHEKAKAYAKALEYCRGALGVQGVAVSDYLRYSKLVLAKSEGLTKQEAEDLGEIAQHLKKEAASHAAGAELQCALGVRTENAALLEECTSELAKLKPNDPQTISYQWALAMNRENFTEAGALVTRAKQSGMQEEGLRRMQETTLREQAWSRRLMRHSRTILVTLLGVAVISTLLLSIRPLARKRARLGTA